MLKTKAKWLVVGGALLLAGLAAMTLVVRAPAPAAPAGPSSGLSRLEQEAAERFKGAEPYVTLPDGKKIPPSNAAHAMAMKVNAFKGILAREAEERDPTFHLKAEAELARRAPVRVSIQWSDLSGNREMDFTVEDSSACKLDGKTELGFPAGDVAQYPCLAQGGDFWDADTKLEVHLEPIGQSDTLWQELLYDTKKAMAAEAHLAGLDQGKGT